MAERKITTKIELTGEAQYKQALSNLSSSLKLYNSELSILKFSLYPWMHIRRC